MKKLNKLESKLGNLQRRMRELNNNTEAKLKMVNDLWVDTSNELRDARMAFFEILKVTDPIKLEKMLAELHELKMESNCCCNRKH